MLAAPILKRMASVADATRCRLLRVLERQELTVSELCSVLRLPQSTVSRHLKTLADDEWVLARRDGTSHFYRMSTTELTEDARGLWSLIVERLGQENPSPEDDRRLAEVLESRRTRSRDFFATTAGQWDRLREELFGRHFHLQALPALLDERWVVGDLGCGTGQVAQSLAPFVGRVIAVDGSPEMLRTARERLRGLDNVDLRQGELEALPIGDQELDAALVVLVLHYLPEPARPLREAARVLRPGGRLLVVDMLPHDREEYQQQMGHVWLGFSEEQVVRHLAASGFEEVRLRALPPDPEAGGPTLFAASARRRTP
jgi:ubiquinone/menaquinone biosynthesis C-methylase UbiE/DNA-binding transcriptional ArsR family regulator